MSSEIQARITDEVKSAMRARAKQRLDVLRLISAEFKKVEVDERVELDDQRVMEILNKMTKQRKDSLSQFESAGRYDLVQQEQYELDVINEFLPEQLDETALTSLVDGVIAATGAESMKDMGKVMSMLKSQAQGRADMAVVGALVKSKLG